jgi:hypothetical protein
VLLNLRLCVTFIHLHEEADAFAFALAARIENPAANVARTFELELDHLADRRGGTVAWLILYMPACARHRRTRVR